MTSITVTKLRQNLYKTIEEVNECSTPIAITNSRGKGAVLIGEDDWRAIEETLHIESIPGMAQSLLEAKEQALEECFCEHEIEW